MTKKKTPAQTYVVIAGQESTPSHNENGEVDQGMERAKELIEWFRAWALWRLKPATKMPQLSRRPCVCCGDYCDHIYGTIPVCDDCKDTVRWD